MTKELTTVQKAAIFTDKLMRLENEYHDEGRLATATRVFEVRVLLMASPDVAARLYDLLSLEAE